VFDNSLISINSMTIKLNSFILSDNIIDKMKKDLDETKIENREIGFIFCLNLTDNILIDRGHCKGDGCKIVAHPFCKADEKFVGGYHTHPGNISEPSIPDMVEMYRQKFECIGGGSDDKIKCYVRKDRYVHYQKMKQLSNYNQSLVKSLEEKLHTLRGYGLTEEYRQKFSEMQKIREELMKHNFNIIGIK
jgi:hypothetical protein